MHGPSGAPPEAAVRALTRVRGWQTRRKATIYLGKLGHAVLTRAVRLFRQRPVLAVRRRGQAAVLRARLDLLATGQAIEHLDDGFGREVLLRVSVSHVRSSCR